MSDPVDQVDQGEKGKQKPKKKGRGATVARWQLAVAQRGAVAEAMEEGPETICVLPEKYISPEAALRAIEAGKPEARYLVREIVTKVKVVAKMV
jgi:hypothetical protein